MTCAAIPPLQLTALLQDLYADSIVHVLVPMPAAYFPEGGPITIIKENTAVKAISAKITKPRLLLFISVVVQLVHNLAHLSVGMHNHKS